MDSATPLPTTLQYLTDAAHLLRATAPQISAHLLSHHANVASHHGVAQAQAQIKKQHVCGACGHIMIPTAAGTDMRLEARGAVRASRTRKQLGADKVHPATSGPSKVFSCGHCRRITRIIFPAPEKPVRLLVKKPMASKKEASTQPEPSNKQSANASSKKRAKTRKTGLQALLSGQKQQSSNPLSLADFMRK